MTVQALSMSLAYCAWLAGERLHHGTFEVDSLDVVDHAARGAGGPRKTSGAGDAR